MSRFIAGFFAVSLALASVSAQELVTPLRFGVTAGLNLSGFANSEGDVSADGFGVGGSVSGVINYQLVEQYSLRAEIGFDYRGYGKEPYFTEMAISVPILFVYHVHRAYGGLGVNIDIPFGTETDYSYLFFKPFEYVVDDRAPVDVGFTACIGYMFTDNVGFEVRGNYNLTKMFDSEYPGWDKWASHTESVRLVYMF